MTLQAVIVFVLLAALIVPVVIAELARRPARRQVVKPAAAPLPKREAPPKTALRLVVNKSDMDRELAALLASSRKTTDEE